MLIRVTLASLACAAAVGFAVPAFADPASLDKELAAIRVKYELPALAAAVAVKGEVVAAGATGVRALGSDIPVTVNDRFHLGSDTKAMTATLAGMLVDAGKLSWDSTVGEVLGEDLPGIGPKLKAVTLRQLLSHSSGIPTDTDEIIKLYFSPDAYDDTLARYRLKIIDAWGKNNEPKVPEGSPFQYANLGYVIVGAMIEKVAGRPWEELITEQIFQPLDLKSAGLGPQATFGKIDAAVGHRIDDKTGAVTPIAWGPGADGPLVVGPAGIAHMSVLDFVKWAAWNAGGGKRGPALVKPETLERIHTAEVKTPEIKDPKPGTPKTGEYAFGWGILRYPWAPNPVLVHNGSNSLNLATVLVDTTNDVAIAVMTNYPGPKADAALGEAVAALYKEYAPARVR